MKTRSIKIAGVTFTTSHLRELGMPIFILTVLAMMILPLPAWALDILFTFNIAVSLLVLLVSTYTKKPLEFAAFPVVILITTLLRLSLNVASTRIVLLKGNEGPDAAGKVIESFGHFLVGGNFAVGIVVFIVLVIINFVVITKGAGRIAEVSARFTLDAMPGKQMAIDADLNAGLISEAEARSRREEISKESDFFGAMDGASKFVRGDAVAGILILLVNILGGLVIGMAQHDMSFAEAGENYILLAIGDGLVAQVPALLISIAAGLVVSRVGDSGDDIGTEVGKQLLGMPQALILSALIVGLLGLIPGMPNLPFLLLASIIGYIAWYIYKQQNLGLIGVDETSATPQDANQQISAAAEKEATWSDVGQVDTVGLEVGYRLIPLVDKNNDGDLLKRIKALRKKFAQEVGFLPSPIHIRDNLELRPGMYRITLKGVVFGEGEVQTGKFLAINPGRVAREIPGTPTKDPAFGLPALWIEGKNREQAQAAGYTVVDPSSVLATHISHLMHSNAAELLGRLELMGLIEHFNETTPKLLDDLVPKLISLSTFQRILQGLLEESVHIRDFRTIIEALTEHAVHVQDPNVLLSYVRIALGRAITQSIFGAAKEVEVIALDQELERILIGNMNGNGEMGAIEPMLADRVIKDAKDIVDKMDMLGRPSALLVPDRLRAGLARLFKKTVPRIRVLAHSEIPESRMIRVGVTLGAK